MASDSLTPKRLRFFEEFLLDLNATQAAIGAGYSEDTARQMGGENLSKPVIAEAIQALVQQRSERTQIKADQVISELARGFGFHSRASFSASAICAGVILDATRSRSFTAWSRFSASGAENREAARLNHICA